MFSGCEEMCHRDQIGQIEPSRTHRIVNSPETSCECCRIYVVHDRSCRVSVSNLTTNALPLRRTRRLHRNRFDQYQLCIEWLCVLAISNKVQIGLDRHGFHRVQRLFLSVPLAVETTSGGLNKGIRASCECRGPAPARKERATPNSINSRRFMVYPFNSDSAFSTFSTRGSVGEIAVSNSRARS